MMNLVKLVVTVGILVFGPLACGTVEEDPGPVDCDTLDAPACEATNGHCRALYGYPYDFDRSCFDYENPEFFSCSSACGNNTVDYVIVQGEKSCYQLSTACNPGAPYEHVGGESCGNTPTAVACEDL